MWGRLLHHQHSGKLVEHRKTSYLGLFFVLALASTVVLAVGEQSRADTNVGIGAVVNAKRPTQAATITNIVSGQQVTSVPMSVSGTCESGMIVKIFRNNVFGGAVFCNSGNYSVPVDLFFGQNSIIARTYNAQGEEGPSSLAVGVTFAPPGGPQPSPFQKFDPQNPFANQLFIITNIFHQGVGGDGVTDWPMEVVGGTAPYAVAVAWGDGQTDVYSRSSAGKFSLKHTYSKSTESGAYSVVVKVRDSQSQTAYVQLVGVVGTPVVASTNHATGLAIAWPILLVLFLVVASFYIGEWREKRILDRQHSEPGQAYAPEN